MKRKNTDQAKNSSLNLEKRMLNNSRSNSQLDKSGDIASMRREKTLQWENEKKLRELRLELNFTKEELEKARSSAFLANERSVKTGRGRVK